MGALRGLRHALLPGARALCLCRLLQLLGAPHAFPSTAVSQHCQPAMSAAASGSRHCRSAHAANLLRQSCSPLALCVQPAEASFTITYKRGIVEGQVGADTLSITNGPIVISNQTFGLATSSTLDFTRAACDGIFVRPLHPSLPAMMASRLLCVRRSSVALLPWCAGCLHGMPLRME